MNKHFGSISDDDDDDMDRPSPLLQTQRFPKPGTMGSKDFKRSTTPTKTKSNEVSNFNIDLNRINDRSLNDSDDDTNTKTGRSTSSATTSPSTPKPKERSFIRNTSEKPKVPPRHIDVDDDDRNVFGQTTMKPSPRHQILSLKDEKERDQSFMKDFQNTEKSRKSPTDLFSSDHKFDSRRSSSKKSPTESDGRQQRQSFPKPRHSPVDSDQSQSRKDSHRNKDDTDQSDDNDDDENLFNKQIKRPDYIKQRPSSHGLVQTSPKDTDSSLIHHQPSSSRPSSGNRRENDSARHSSYGDEQDAILPSTPKQTTPSRPTSAKTNTTRQHTQSVIDNVSSANAPSAFDPLTSNNEALAATLHPSSSPPQPPPRPSAQLPPRPKSSLHTTRTTGGINKKQKFPVSSRYKNITPKVDDGRTPVDPNTLQKSVDLALKKALKTQTLPRPESSRARKPSANSSSGNRQRRRSSSAYENVKPRVNTNLSINFDELNTSQMRADSSQSIKDSVYLEWLKTKQDQKKVEKEELKRWQEENKKRVNENQIKEKLRQQAESLQRWREEKDRETKEKRKQELELHREEKEKKKQQEQQKLKDAQLGFSEWTAKKKDHVGQKDEEERKKKAEIEKQQEEKRKKVFEAEKAYDKWINKKTREIQKNEDAKKKAQEQLKTIRQEEEMKFVNAQEAYEKWLKEKDKYELEDKINKQRRDSLSAQQPQAPFLPGGSQKNTGRIRHVVW